MPFDYKKEHKEIYMPKAEPVIIKIPRMNYIAVRGKGNPNVEGGEYKAALELLYGIAYTIKMSYKGDYKIDGYFEYVVPPLEGFWWQAGVCGANGAHGVNDTHGTHGANNAGSIHSANGKHGIKGIDGVNGIDSVGGAHSAHNTDNIDYSRKDAFSWIAIIRLPDFVGKNDFEWAIATATKKKKMDFSSVEFLTYDEGLCVQCMHIGSYDDEPVTVQKMKEFSTANGHEIDISPQRFHHEIYLNDPRKTEVFKLKTVIRHPIK